MSARYFNTSALVPRLNLRLPRLDNEWAGLGKVDILFSICAYKFTDSWPGKILKPFLDSKYKLKYEIYLKMRRAFKNSRMRKTRKAFLDSKFKTNYESNSFYYDYHNQEIHFKLLETNQYKAQLKQVYPLLIDEDQLTNEMIAVIKQYTSSYYYETNLRLLSNLDIEWDYTNKLRSIIRGLNQSDLRNVYYRGVDLSDLEVSYYIEKVDKFYYTNSFLSFTAERELVFPYNSLLILHTAPGNRLNIANVWRWSTYPHEMEAILSIASKLKILGVHQEADRSVIQVQLIEND
jgi:hypothetical protein